jgi:hypothetical protein|tara:strand:+ start:452 stop:673 length:222 start_codon:yes stop_codon:yes gene_type:complete
MLINKRGITMIKDSLMRKMNKEMKELKAKKPVKENKYDMFYQNRLKRWHIAKAELHNKICDRAITLLNRGNLH